MNLISLIKTDDINKFPQALRDLANEVEDTIKIMGAGANCLGDDENGNTFNFFIDDKTNEIGFAGYFDEWKKNNL